MVSCLRLYFQRMRLFIKYSPSISIETNRKITSLNSDLISDWKHAVIIFTFSSPLPDNKNFPRKDTSQRFSFFSRRLFVVLSWSRLVIIVDFHLALLSHVIIIILLLLLLNYNNNCLLLLARLVLSFREGNHLSRTSSIINLYSDIIFKQ